MMERTCCNYCHSEEYLPLYQIPDLLLENFSNSFSFVRCTQCGLIYQNPRIKSTEISKYYPNSYESYQEIDPKGSLLLGIILRYGLKKRKNFVYKYCKGGKLLDIGCSTGDFLDEIGDYGRNNQWELFGVEISEYAANIARKKNHLRIFNSTLEGVNFPDRFFDVITLWDVLEHLHDPFESLLEMNRILKPGGILLVRVPNFDSMDRSIFKSNWAGWDAPRHLYVFGKTNIKALLNKTGFSIKNINTNIGSYTTFLLSLRFSLARRRALKNRPSRILDTLYSPLFRIISAPLFYIISASGFGPLMVIASVKEK